MPSDTRRESARRRETRAGSLVFCALPVLFALFATGCDLGIWRIGPAAATPGLITSDVVFQNEIQPDPCPDIPYDPSTLEITGWVQSQKKSFNLIGRVPGTWDDEVLGMEASDYASTYRRILDEHNLDGLLNTTVDTRSFKLDFYLVGFSEQWTTLGGVGYRFRRGALWPGASREVPP